MSRKGLPTPKDLREPWQIANAAKCGCGGADDMCPCQNDPDHFKPKPSRDDLTDEIAALQAEVARLREALGWFLADPQFQVAVGGNPIVVERMLAAARAALQPKENADDHG